MVVLFVVVVVLVLLVVRLKTLLNLLSSLQLFHNFCAVMRGKRGTLNAEHKMPSASGLHQAGRSDCASLRLRVLAILAHLTENPIHKTAAWACPIPRTLTRTCVALFAVSEVQVLAARACPIVRVAVHPIAPLAGGISVVAAVLAIVVTRSPLLDKRTSTATCGQLAM